MILGLGIDLVSINKIGESAQHEAFRHKVFTPGEIAVCEAFASSAEHFAGKFAAKEAFMKAIGRGIRQEVWFTHIEILNRANGMPFVQLNGEAERVALELRVGKIHISVTHTADMAMAVVILESE